MRVLLVKTSSLGDLVHSFPALSDAAAAVPGIRFDWVVEEAFAEVPAWHPAVDRVIPIALRRWRKDWRKAWSSGELPRFYRALRERTYDLVIDAQGLLFKSGLVARFARGARAGFDRRSAREPWSSICYQRRYSVDREQHAIDRVRQLFAQALGYDVNADRLEFGLRPASAGEPNAGRPYLVFLVNTTWESKHWPEVYWAELSALAARQGYRILLPWYSPDDRLRAERIMRRGECGELLPRMGLTELAQVLAKASGVLGVDSGLSHIAAALGVPTLVIYGPTSATLTGARGARAATRSAAFPCAPCLQKQCSFVGESAVRPACFEALDPEAVWNSLSQLQRLQRSSQSRSLH